MGTNQPAPGALTPQAIEAKAEGAALTKTQLTVLQTCVLAMLAGGFIALGGMFFGLVLGDGSLSFIATRLLGGLCFSLGLTLVLCCGAELFTGNSLMVCAAMSKGVQWTAVLKNWALVWLGNFAGALVVVALVYFSRMADMNGGEVGVALVNLAASKMSLSFGTAFAKGILCNILVCLAVWIGFAATSIADKVLGLLLPITAFVACGFEHCVANMFFLPMGMLLQAHGVGAASTLTFAQMFANLGAVTLGNLVGGAVVVGLAYWVVYGRKAAKDSRDQ